MLPSCYLFAGIMDDISALKVLFIEPNANVRSSLQDIFTQWGVTQIDHVMRASAAITLLQKKQFDIVLCEFDLTEGQDGQQLLEDLREHRLLPLTTLFLMVTAERDQGRVISTVELGPTEYLLKPFTAGFLVERLERALEKRVAFKPAYVAIDHGDLQEAIACCERGETLSRRYALDFRFLRADLHLRQGQLAQAESIYAQLAETKAAEAARLGLAKVWRMQNRMREAEEMLTALLEKNRKLWEAYDCLAEVLEADGRSEEAKQVLKEAVELSPHTVRRLRKLGRLALETGDIETALPAYHEVVDKMRYSRFREPEDYVHLVRSLLGTGNPAQADAAVHELSKARIDFKKTEACSSLSYALIDEFNGELERAQEQLTTAIGAYNNNAGLSHEVKLVLAQSCLNNGMEDNAAEIILDIMNNASGDAARAKAVAILERAGRTDLINSLAEKSKQYMVDLLAACQVKIEKADYRGAVDLMTHAAHQMSDNPEVALNAASVMLTCIGNTGWNDELGAQAYRYIENARRLDPAHPRLPDMLDVYRGTLKKYSIPFKHVSAKSRVRV